MLTKNTANSISAIIIAAAIAFTSCRKEDIKTEKSVTQSESSLKEMISENGSNLDEAVLQNSKTLSKGGYVYTESNDAAQNSILIYKQHSNGNLSLQGTVASGGAGIGKGLGSQGALVLDEQHAWLYAVNAGDNSVSSFWVHNDGSLTLAHTVKSGGVTPVSVSVYEHFLYVVNSVSANICGFYIGSDGALTKIEGSAQSLSSSDAAPAQISFRPDGKVLYVTEKMANKIATFKVNNHGVASAGAFHESVGQTPFGFDFSRNANYLIVSNAAGGAPNASSCTSYSTDRWGNINNINGAVPDFQSAACWVATTYHGRFAFVTNTGSNSISSYYVSPFGGLYLIFFTITPTGKAPIDITVSGDNYYVYNINDGSHTIGEYKRGSLGTLNKIGHVPDLPPYASGLAAY